MPVVSPVVAAAIYLRKYRGVAESFAFLTPCVCKRQEIDLYGRAKTGIEYCVTIRELQQQLLQSGEQIDSLPPVDYTDAAEPFAGESLSVFGGIGACLSRAIGGFRYRQASGAGTVYPLLDSLALALATDEVLADLLELNHCCRGCDGGAGIGPAWPFSLQQPPERLMGSVAKQTLPNVWRCFDETLAAADFAWPIDQVKTTILSEGRKN
jgi:iron only hydrogenase large subunit-like protein